jgi:glycosyltransferase involved in cell wall biosynthesis
LENFYAAADCLVFASEQETMPLALQEAAILGVPRIVSMYPGYEELIPNDHFAFLYPTGDVTSLRNRMNYLIEHRDESLIVAQRAREFQASRLTDNIHVLHELMDSVYRNRLSLIPASWNNEKN